MCYLGRGYSDYYFDAIISGLGLLGVVTYIYATTHMEWVIGSFDGCAICIATKWPRPNDQTIHTLHWRKEVIFDLQHYMLNITCWSALTIREKKINKSYVLVLNDDIVAGTPLQWTDGGWKINIWWNWKVWTIFVFSGEVRVPALAEGWEGGGGGEGPQPPPNQASHQQVTKSYFSSHPALDSRPKVPSTP